MPFIRHLNLPNAEGEIYCCLRNRVVTLDEEQRQSFCGGCRMFGGDVGGRGVVCDWDDARDIPDPYTVTDPYREWSGIQIRTTPLKPQSPDPGCSIFLGVSY